MVNGGCSECIDSPFLLELKCPYNLLRSIAMTAWGMAAQTATTAVSSSSGTIAGCGCEAAQTRDP